MKEKNRYWQIFNDDILKNKKLLCSVIFVTVICFGFTITNFSIGIDDAAAFNYFSLDGIGNMIQQGRLLHVVLDLIAGTGQFIPFFNDFVGASMLAVSALLFCAVFQLITDNKISDLGLIAFSTVYISCPVIASKFIYNLDVIPTTLSYCALAVAIGYSYIFVRKNKKSDFLLAMLFLMISISSYESFILFYICAVFAMFILKITVNDEKIKFKDYIFDGIKYLTILLISVTLYYVVVFIVQACTGQLGQFIRGVNVPHTDFLHSLIDKLLLFTIFVIVGLVLNIIYSVKKKSPVLLISYIFMIVFCLLIFVVLGCFVNRVLQAVPFVMGFITLEIIFAISQKNCLKRIAIVLLALVVFNQSANMNIKFYDDYKNYQKSKAVVNIVANDLLSVNTDKPVVFVGDRSFSQNDNYSKRLPTLIRWGLKTFDESFIDNPQDRLVENPFEIEIYKMHGYDYIKKPTKAQAYEGIEIAKDMPEFPKNGYIKECDEFIVVKMQQF